MAKLSEFNQQGGGTPTHEQVPRSLQESILSLLAYSDEYGELVANMVSSNLFEGDYRVVGERCIEFWKQHKQAPKSHTIDLVQDIVGDPDNKKARTYERILLLMSETLPEVNAEFVLQQIQQFTRTQETMITIMQSAEIVEAKRENGVAEVEQLLWGYLRNRTDTKIDMGVRLNNVDRILSSLATVERSEFITNIPLLDRLHITPARKTLTVLLASTGIGKSWYLLHMGKQALKLRGKIVYVTLEMSDDAIMRRYIQNLMALPTLHGGLETLRPVFQVNDDGALTGISYQKVTADFALESVDTRAVADFFHNYRPAREMVLKAFPERTLTFGGLSAFLDTLTTGPEPFKPDILILDYASKMRIEGDLKNYRIALGNLIQDLKALAVERNIAVVTAHQANREGAKAARVDIHHVGEDFSVVQTADYVLTLSRSEAEKVAKLARLYVAKARESQDGWGVVIGQNYTHGQFVLDSVRLDGGYPDLLAQAAGSMHRMMKGASAGKLKVKGR